MSQTITLDLKFVLALALANCCTTYLKLIDEQSYYSIFTLIKDLTFSQKYQIMINLFRALTIVNSNRVN